MSRSAVDMHRLQELVRLHRQGVGAREIARLLQMSPNTERKYREAFARAEVLEGAASDVPELSHLRSIAGVKRPPQERSSIDDWRDEVKTKFDGGAQPKAIFDWLKANESEFKGSYWAIKRLCKQLRKDKPAKAADVVMHVVTAPGEEAQVDFGYVGMLIDPESGKLRKAWVFVMVLSHSRHLFAKTVFDQRAETWQRLHVDAFRFFGGVPKVIVPDNLKAAVIRAAFGAFESPELNRSYRELARHYGFRIDPTPAYSPEKKGKVESAVKYVKRSFFDTWTPTDVEEANREVLRWNEEVAGQRTHGTTGKRPHDVFRDEEFATLLPLPRRRYETIIWKEAKVHRDAHIQFERRLYSVPFQHIGKTVWVKATPTTLMVLVDDVRVATHVRSEKKRVHTNVAHLPTERLEICERSAAYWQDRASRVGEDVGQWVHELIRNDDVLSNVRVAQSVVTLVEKYPKDRSNAACRRALHFGNLTYVAVRDILRKALDKEELPDEEPVFGKLSNPTFARSSSEIIH